MATGPKETLKYKLPKIKDYRGFLQWESRVNMFLKNPECKNSINLANCMVDSVDDLVLATKIEQYMVRKESRSPRTIFKAVYRFVVHKNRDSIMDEFFSRKKKKSETVESYANDVFLLGTLVAATDDQIRYNFVKGLPDTISKGQLRIVCRDSMSWNKLVQRATEALTQDDLYTRGKEGNRQRRPERKFPSGNSDSKPKPEKKVDDRKFKDGCWECGAKDHLRNECPAWSKNV